MARITATIVLAITGTLALQGNVGPQPELAQPDHDDLSDTTSNTQPTVLNPDQRQLVNLAKGRFEAQALELPDVNFVFHPDLQPCNGHKGMYHKSTRTLEMCSMDLHTMLHELAHAWANTHLTAHQMQVFVAERNLDSWNDHNHAWERRGTEHVAETIAWALAVDPHHVKWVEESPDGFPQTTHRILTLDVDVDTLVDNFRDVTGMDPIYRHIDEWTLDEAASTPFSPELGRFGG